MQDCLQPVSHRLNGGRLICKSDAKSARNAQILSGLWAEPDLKHRALESGRFDPAVVRRSRLANQAIGVHTKPTILVRDNKGPLQLDAMSGAVFVLRED